MIAGLVAGAVIVAGSSFYGGMQYAQMSRGARITQGTGAGQNFPGTAGARGNRFTGGGFAVGTVVSKDTSGITIQLSQGAPGSQTSTQGTGSKIILVNGSTQIMKTSAGSLEDVSNGENVMVQGKQNSDGSITAESIQIRPAGTPAGRGQ